jgi:hypothetical protein
LIDVSLFRATILQTNRWNGHGCSNIRKISGNRQPTHGTKTNISIPNKNQIVGYYRCADDFLIIYDQKKTNIDKTLIELNKQLINIKFTIEKEINNSNNFLDITIHRKKTELEFAIYRKHTQTLMPLTSI